MAGEKGASMMISGGNALGLLALTAWTIRENKEQKETIYKMRKELALMKGYVSDIHSAVKLENKTMSMKMSNLNSSVHALKMKVDGNSSFPSKLKGWGEISKQTSFSEGDDKITELSDDEDKSDTEIMLVIDEDNGQDDPEIHEAINELIME
jgi:hypothetical protein